MRKDITTIRVEPPIYNLRTIAEEKGKKLHRSTKVAKLNLTMEQSHQQKQLSQEGSDDDW